MQRSSVIIRLAVLALILIVVNMISSKLYFRLDFTEDQRYTLSDATTDILTEIEDVITVKAYFSENLPSQLISTRQDFEDILLEYENRSDGNVVYEFVSPNEDEAVEAEAQQNGIQPRIVQIPEKDKVQQLQVYMGVVLMMGDRKEIIPFVLPGVDMEYDLTTSIKKLSVIEKPKVAILQGHGEPSVQEVGQLAQQLSVLYNVEPVDLTKTNEIGSEFKTLAIINPSDTITQQEFAIIDAYMSKGGNVFLAYSNLSSDLSTAYLSKGPDIGIEGWLREKSIVMGSQFVVDDQSGSVNVQQRMRFGMMNQRIKFPYFPIISEFPDHAITKGLEGLQLPFVSSLSFNSVDSAMSSFNLLNTSPLSGLAPTPSQIDIQKKWGANDYREGSQTIALAVEGPLAGAINSKIIAVSNGQFIVNGDPPQQLSDDNINFAANAIDWLSDDTGLIDLRTKGITARPLDTVEDGTREMLKWGNVFIPILLVFIYGFIRRQIYLKKKQGWMEGKY
ncbi:MAG: Gldg family protein [Reichenbachiella sp.]